MLCGVLFSGDQIVLFADKVLKFTGSGKMKYRYLMITDFAIYLIDPETDYLKRRIALAAVEKICVSELTDNFLAVIIPTEYDLLIASARKNEIITAFVEAYEPEVVSSNRYLEFTPIITFLHPLLYLYVIVYMICNGSLRISTECV